MEAKVSQISDFIEKLLRSKWRCNHGKQLEKKINKEKTKTFESDLGEAGEVLR